MRSKHQTRSICMRIPYLTLGISNIVGLTQYSPGMILHHLTHDAHKCIEECYRVLKKGGRFVVCENVALTRVVEEFQKQCLKLKETDSPLGRTR